MTSDYNKKPPFQNRSRQPVGLMAFTLIELLVAMAILLILVGIIGQIFQQANIAWNTGLKNVEMTMKGRSVADMIAQELSQAIATNTGDFKIDGGGAVFYKLSDATASNNYSAISQITYGWSGSSVTRDGVELADGINKVQVDYTPGTPAVPLPTYVTVLVTVSNNIYQTKAFMRHRDRYLY